MPKRKRAVTDVGTGVAIAKNTRSHTSKRWNEYLEVIVILTRLPKDISLLILQYHVIENQLRLARSINIEDYAHRPTSLSVRGNELFVSASPCAGHGSIAVFDQSSGRFLRRMSFDNFTQGAQVVDNELFIMSDGKEEPKNITIAKHDVSTFARIDTVVQIPGVSGCLLSVTPSYIYVMAETDFELGYDRRIYRMERTGGVAVAKQICEKRAHSLTWCFCVHNEENIIITAYMDVLRVNMVVDDKCEMVHEATTLQDKLSPGSMIMHGDELIVNDYRRAQLVILDVWKETVQRQIGITEKSKFNRLQNIIFRMTFNQKQQLLAATADKILVYE